MRCCSLASETSNGGNTGHAHIFALDNEEWQQEGPNIEGEAAGDQYGYDIAISGNGQRLAVAAPFNRGTGQERGRVKVLAVNGV